MFEDPIDPLGLPYSTVILQPYWQYSVKRKGTHCSRMYCNGSKNGAPQLQLSLLFDHPVCNCLFK